MSECGCELFFGCFCEREDESAKLSACRSLRSCSDIPGDDLHLVELAHLYRDIVENVEKSSSPVDHGRKDGPAFLFENGAAIAVVGHEFACNLIPPNVLGEWPGTEDADTILPAPEGRVSDDNGRVRCEVLFGNRDGIELFAHPYMRAVMLLGKLFESLLFFDVSFPYQFTRLCVSLW